MASGYIIRHGDPTTKGGRIIAHTSRSSELGVGIATRKDFAVCCGGVQKFVQWCLSVGNDLDAGENWIIDKCRLSCGCYPISSDPTFTITDDLGGGGPTAATARAMPAAVEPTLFAPAQTAPTEAADYLLHYVYPDLDDTPVRGVSYRATLADGEVRTGTLSPTGYAALPQAAPGPVNVEYQVDVPDDDDDGIVQARERVRQGLAAIVAQTRQDFAAEWKEWNRASTLKRLGLKALNTQQGMAKGAWDWVSGTAETIWQAAVLLAKGNQEVAEIGALVMAGEWDALDQKIAGWRASGEKVLRQASEIKEQLILIFHDAPVRELLVQFGQDWWAAIPPDESEELKARYGSQIGIDIAISVLLAAFTAGSAGAAYGGAKWAATVGRLGAKAVRLMDDLVDAFKALAKALKLRKRRLVETGRTANADGVIESRWEGKVRGEKVDLPGVKTRKIDYKKRDRAEYKKLRGDFNRKHKKEFLDSVASDPKKVEALKRAGLSDADIDLIRNGEVPDEWQVHHKLPLDDGGTNDLSNLVLIKNDPYHMAVTNEQLRQTRSLGVGDSKVLDWPEIPGFVYPPKPDGTP